MTFIKLSLINAHSVGSFFGCQNLPAVFGAAEVGDQFIFCFTQLSLIIKGAVSRPVHLFNFANYSPSIAIELKVSKEITCKWQNRRSETNKYVSWALLLKLQAAGINSEKLLGWKVLKNPYFNPFQSSSVLPIRSICCFCYVILTFL